VPGSLSYAVVKRGHVTDLSRVTCTLGRHDRPYPETHVAGAWTIAMVRRGTFRYRSAATNDRPELRPGWLLLGRPGSAFECGHDHDQGDECASLVVPEAVFDDARGGADRAARDALATVAALPPVARVAALLEHAGRCDAADVDLDEIACLVAEAVVARAAVTPRRDATCARRHTSRAHEAMARIETASDTPLSLDQLAAAAGLTPFHFLRVFRRVTGTTPHQYLVGARVRAAIRLLLDTERPITRVAYDAGFRDLSNFNHTFRRIVGCSPRAYRRGRL
jgi:AraC-like DNA-binding protein